VTTDITYEISWTVTSLHHTFLKLQNIQ